MPSNFPFIVDDGLGRGRSFFKLCSSAQENREERQEVFLSFLTKEMPNRMLLYGSFVNASQRGTFMIIKQVLIPGKSYH